MTLPTPHTIGHAIYAAGPVDSHNNPTDTWAAPVSRPAYSIAPLQSTEPGGTQVVTGLTVLAPAFAVDPRDRFVISSVTYEVVGDVADWNDGPFGFAPGMEVHLKRVAGGR